MEIKSGLLIRTESFDVKSVEERSKVKFSDLDGKWVEIEGVFHVGEHPDSLLAFGGELHSVYAISLASLAPEARKQPSPGSRKKRN